MINFKTNARFIDCKFLLVLLVALGFFLLFRQDLNQQLFLWLNNQFFHPLIWQFVTILGDALVLVAVLLPLYFKHEKFRLLIFWGGLICWIFIRIGKLTFAELRPLSVLPTDIFFVSGISLYHSSFPSGHSATIATVMFATLRTFTFRKIYICLFLILIFLVAFSRIAVGAHWPVDIVFGILVGLLSILIAERMFLIFRLLSHKFFSLISTTVFFAAALYVPWHKTGYEIANELITAWLIIALIAIAIPKNLLNRFGDDRALAKTYFMFVAFVWIFFVFENVLGWNVVFKSWKNISIWHLVGLLSLTALSYWIRALRLQVHYPTLMKGKLSQAYWISSWHNLMNNLLPFRFGELVYPALLKKNFGISLMSSLTTLLAFRILDLYAIGFLGIAVFCYYQSKFIFLVYSLILFLVFPVILWLFFSRLFNLKFFSNLVNKFNGGEFSSRAVFFSATLSLLNWLCKLLAFSILLKSISGLDFFSAFVGSVGGELSSVSPFHGVMGFGTYEAGVSIALSLMGIKFDGALLAAINLHLFVLLSSIFSVFIALLLRIKKNDN